MEDPRTAFCREEHPRLVGALRLHTGDATLAEDLAAEALARACAEWPRVSAAANPGAYTHRIAMNLAASWFRRRAAERRATARATDPARGVHHDPDAAEAAEVRAAVAALPTRQRSVLICRYFLDHSVAETAVVLRCAEGTVKSLTSKAVANLRRTLGPDAEEVVRDQPA